MNTYTQNFMKKAATLAMVACILTIGFSGCKKAEELTALFDQSSVDNTTAEAQFNDLNDVSSDAMSSQGKFLVGEDKNNTAPERGGAFRNCGNVTIDVPTKTITVDFGTGNTTACNDGKIRNGKIIITYTDKYMTPGSVITTTPQNYTVNGNKVEGTKTVTCVTTDLAQPKHRMQVSNGKVTFLTGESTTWTTDKVRTWTTGAADQDKTNDVWTFTGSGSGTNRKGNAYTWLITQALVVKSACFASGIYKPVAGEIKVTASGSDKIINYGSGICDKTVTVTVGGRTFTFNAD
jgi:hypothetical protein